jgi:hypothetical protein
VRASFLAGIQTSGETIDRLRITAFREAQSYKGLINPGKTGSISTLFFFAFKRHSCVHIVAHEF